jgi:4-aminobutyrate aminotransferase/(S)-3-amino-2-methylpropionate transaminase
MNLDQKSIQGSQSNQALQERKNAVIARGQGNIYPVFVNHAKNAEVWDVENNRYIDFGSGIAVCNTGHSHPMIVAAVKHQMEKFSHSCVMVNPYEVAIELAEKLIAIAPGKSPKKAVLVSTGAEAVENCIKIARAYTKRRGVVAFNGGFHGRTNMTMALTGKMAPYKKDFGPFPADIYHVPFPNDLHGITVDDSLGALHTLFKVAIAAQDVAAIIVEPVQGEGGFYQAPVAFMRALRALCDEYGIVLIADEIQTGFARTGKMFCCEYSDVEPDLITMAKGIAGGLPLAAVVGKTNIMDAPLPGGLGGTYGGSPVACAAALAVLDVIEKENILAHTNQMGALFAEHLYELKNRYPGFIAEVRQIGAMLAIELVCEGDIHKPNVALTQEIIGKAADYGLILLACGFYGNVIRFLPPLTIEQDILEQGVAKFKQLFQDVIKLQNIKTD